MTSKRSNIGFVLRLSAAAAFGGLLFGFDTAVISGAIPYIKDYFHLGAAALGWAVSAILIGCAIGAMTAGNFADRYGRKPTLLLCASLFALSGIGVGLSQDFILFVVMRIIGGLGVGAAAMVAPMYIAESVPASSRGRLVALYQLAILVGIMLAYFSNYFLDGHGPDSWRWMFGVQVVPAGIFALLMLLAPESPRWLAAKGKHKHALFILSRIMGLSGAMDELQNIRQSFSANNVRLAELLDPQYRRVLGTGILIAIFQQVTGINAILYYAPEIFRQTGLNSDSALLQTIIIGAVNMLSTFAAILLVDRLGRRPMLLAGSAVMGLSILGVAACFYFNYFAHYVVLIFVLLYVGAFGGTLGAVTWVYLSEIFPNRIRGLALSVATLALWLADFLVSYTFPVMTSVMGTGATLAVYALLCLIAAFYTLTKIPETKGCTLEAIDAVFAREKQNR